MRLVTYNIRGGLGMDGVRSIQRIAEVLRGLEADVICLQEVHKHLPGSRFVDQPARLSRFLGMPIYFQANYRVGPGEYGNAILTRLPTRRLIDERLQNARERASILRRMEGRGILGCAVEVSGLEILVLCTHWSLDQTDRLEAISVIRQILDGWPGAGILAGDLNATDDTPEVLALSSELGLKDTGAGTCTPTFTSSDPVSRIDYVFVSSTLQAGELRVIATRASDHLPVILNIEVQRN